MKWALAGSGLLGLFLGAPACWGASFVNATDAAARTPPRSERSLEEPPEDAPRPRPTTPAHQANDTVSLTFSPLHLILPMLKATAEFRPAPHSGLAVFGGYGEQSFDVTDQYGAKSDASANAYLLGVQVIAYPLRKFDGVQLGLQAQYVHVDVEGKVSNSTVSGAANGFALGLFGGYKWIAPVGFTMALQGGLQYLAIQANARDDAGNSASPSDSRFAPLLNFDLGWSF